jgi:hypothetical protein
MSGDDRSSDADLAREGWDVGHALAVRVLTGAVVAIDAGNISADRAVAELAVGLGGWMADIVRSELPPSAITGRVHGVMGTLADLALVGLRAVRDSERRRGGGASH